MAPGDPLDRLPDSERALLRLLAWLAACEGETVPPEELELLERLVALSLLAHHTGGDPEGAAARLLATAPHGAAIEDLVTALESPRQRQLLAYQGQRMVGCHGSNPAAQQALERLLALLGHHGSGIKASACIEPRLQRKQGSPLMPPLPESLVRLHSDRELRLVTPTGFCIRRLRWQTGLGPLPASLGEIGLLGQQKLNAYYAYRTLFSGLTLAQLLLPLAVFGLQPALVALVLALGLVVVAGPSRPLVPWRHEGVHLMPVAQPLALAMGASIVLSVAAYWTLLAPGLVAKGWPAATSLLPLVCNGAGGALEATQAETTYNQWWHLVAVVVLSGGSLLYGLLLAVAA
jgi:hypothetical protein